MIKNTSFSGVLRRAAAVMAALAAVLCSPAFAASAVPSHVDLPAVYSEQRLTVASMFTFIDSGADELPMRFDVRPITLAQLEDQLRRPDVQASIGKGTIAVLYPNVEMPFRASFISMIQGIEERTRLAVRSYPVDARVDAAELNATLKQNGTKVVIALGRQGLNATAGLDREISVVVGGVLLLSDAENVAGISLTPDPALLFARLHALLPDLKRVIVVYNPKNSEWLIKLAREAARAQGLELAAYVAGDMARAAQLYPTLIAGADGRRDAVWLPHDSTTVEESTILPLVLRETWNSGVPLFSSNVLHVKKGALFAMVPNNVEMGRTLANSALNLMAEPRKRGNSGLAPSRTLQTAINLRTANHVGLQIGYQQQRSFDFVFPQP